MMECISIEWYPGTSIFMLYAAMNAMRGLKNATDWSGTKSIKSSKEIKFSCYQSIDKKYTISLHDDRFSYLVQKREIGVGNV
jgi:hypothetical protein